MIICHQSLRIWRAKELHIIFSGKTASLHYAVSWLVVTVSINFFWKSENFDRWLVFVALQNKKVTNFLWWLKGQLISKCLFVFFNFFQKTNENKSTWNFIVVKYVIKRRIFTKKEKYENTYEPGVVGSELLGTVEFLGQLILKKWLVPQNIRSPFRNTVALDTSFPLMQVLAPIKSKMHVNNVFSAYHNGMKSFPKYYSYFFFFQKIFLWL